MQDIYVRSTIVHLHLVAMPKAKQRSSKRLWRGETNESTLPPPLRSRLADLFGQIEREFEMVCSENAMCKCKLLFILIFLSLMTVKVVVFLFQQFLHLFQYYFTQCYVYRSY